MTIPSRPAPAPPIILSRGQSAAAGANASLEQLRMQLQQQQEQQQQHHQQQQQQQKQVRAIQNTTIKLPPPPKDGRPLGFNNNNYKNFSTSKSTSSSSITRKFPQARYAPATNWDDAPFDALAAPTTTTATTNGGFKKMPPPRPPPPKVSSTGPRKTPTPLAHSHSANILTNIFHRKKVTKTSTASNAASRVYGISSGNYGTVSSVTASSATTNNYSTDWNAAWDTTTTTATITATTTSSSHFMAASTQSQSQPPQDALLISFDSPPSSPTFTQQSASDCVSVDSFSSDSNFSSPQNGSVSQPESGFEDDFSAASRSRPPTTSPLDPWETIDAFGGTPTTADIGTAPVRNFTTTNTRIQASNDNPLCNGKSLLPPAPSLHMPTIIKPKVASQKPKAPKPPTMTKPFQKYQQQFSGFDTAAATPPSAFSSMPVGVPPQPPPPGGVTLLDVISGKADAIHLSSGNDAAYGEESSQPYGLALYDFDGTEEGDLNFRENQKIYLLEQVSETWYRGRTRAGCEGIFPINYIDIKVPLPAENVTNSSQANAPSSTLPRVRCLYNFAAEVEGDLALKENELVTILYRINEDWLYGEIDGRQGQFPSNFLEYVPGEVPLP